MIAFYSILGEAYRLKVLFNNLWEMPSKQAAKIFIEQRCREVELSKIPAFMNLANTVKAHLSGIINYVETHITNAILESINNKIQMAKQELAAIVILIVLSNIIYFLCGKLTFNYPLYSS